MCIRDSYNAINADSGLLLRELLNRLNNWMQTVQGAAFAVVIFFGVPDVMAAQMSTGLLVAASILVSRMPVSYTHLDVYKRQAQN